MDDIALIDERIKQRQAREQKKKEEKEEKARLAKEKKELTEKSKAFKEKRGIDPSKPRLSALELDPDSTLLAEINGLPHGGQYVIPDEKRWKYFGNIKGSSFKFYMSRYKLAQEILGEEKFPKYDRLICSMCGAHIDAYHNALDSSFNGFYNSGLIVNANRNYAQGAPQTTVCIHCIDKLYDYFLAEYGEDGKREAIERLCAELNIYFDWEIYCKEEIHNIKVGLTAKTPMGQYIECLDRKGKNLPFFYSPHIQAALEGKDLPKLVDGKSDLEKKRIGIVANVINKEIEEGDLSPSLYDANIEELADKVLDSLGKSDYDMTPYFEWAKDERLARQRIIKIYKYDPFGDETDLDAKKKMYRDLELMLDENMETNSIKLNGAVSIVKAYRDIRRYEGFIEELEQAGNPDVKQIKAMQEILNYKRDTVLKIAKENGFNTDGKTGAQNKNTLSGRMAEMKSYMYEPGLVDFYGVRTTKSFQEISDMSFKSIFEQIALTEGDWKEMVTDQSKTIRKQHDEIVKLKEELRQAYIEIEKNKLATEAKEESKGEW